jgi:hypothetical protein
MDQNITNVKYGLVTASSIAFQNLRLTQVHLEFELQLCHQTHIR